MNKQIEHGIRLDSLSKQLESLTMEIQHLKENKLPLLIDHDNTETLMKPLLKIRDVIQLSGDNLTRYTITKDIEMGRLKVVPRGGKKNLIPKEDALKYLHIT